MFSANGIAAMTFTFGLSSASARIDGQRRRRAAMSSFIVSIQSACLIDRPPESNVMPLPVIAIGLADAPPPR